MRSPTNCQTSPPSRNEDEEEWQPGPENALEHRKASLDEECDHKSVHQDYDAKKCSCGAKWRPRVWAVKIGERKGNEDSGCGKRVYDQSGPKTSNLHSHTHGRTAQDPAYESVGKCNRYPSHGHPRKRVVTGHILVDRITRRWEFGQSAPQPTWRKQTMFLVNLQPQGLSPHHKH